ncbi:MAG TPA: glycogen/starch/alpha-glucan phosphorylase [Candidatus Binataceae bacterium]|nr:glycogen/starch/alpha-glucan phosphorylase [Candidatus Binataceae bacterium]
MPSSTSDISVADIKRRILDNLEAGLARQPQYATRNDWYTALALAVRGLLVAHWYSGTDVRAANHHRVVAYLSAEFLLGPHLHNNIIGLGVYPQVERAVAELGQNLQDLLWQEQEPGLGNGGLGRLAACFMDSLATLQMPAIGYGIRYEFGIFRQEIRDGWQVEISDEWLRTGNPWEIARPQNFHYVRFGGKVESATDAAGRTRPRWVPDQIIRGVAYDTPILGYRVPWVNLLRLWKAEAYESFDFQAFNTGDYYGAVEDKVQSENITKVLYPNDEQVGGKILRLEQQYFFASCSLQDMLRLHRLRRRPVTEFHRYWTIQLNDTHPSIAVAELMRLLLDDYELGWQEAWEITRHAFAYTNHTLLPEALEKWPLELFGRLLPRHLQIVYEINERFLAQVRERHPGDPGRIARMSIIDEAGDRYVRMAHLATVASRRVNGVAELHSELLKRDVMSDFAEIYPDKFTNVTNGVTPRRWLAVSNPSLTELITSKIGGTWLSNLETELRAFEKFADDPEVQDAVRLIKFSNKRDLAELAEQLAGTRIDPASMFDVQVKRIHEYKRQHLNVLHIIALYQRLKRDPAMNLTPRTFIFGGKAAPGYTMAKLIIKLINSVAGVIDGDRQVDRRLKVVFIPDFNVKTGQHIYPAADLSEQISTAGKEASGTGNMKFAMNGALTIGTLDGANIEIRGQVGAENFFLFGLSAKEVSAAQAAGYRPREFYDQNEELQEVIDAIAAGAFSRGDREMFRPLVDSLLNHDPFLVLADYQSYVDCQSAASEAYRDERRWAQMSILNIARMGNFSSDRAIREYDEKIWRT